MRKHILCTLLSASTLINGIAFAASEDPAGMLSVDPVDDETADYFAAIDGYKVIEVGGKPTQADKDAAAATEAAKVAEAEEAAQRDREAAEAAERDRVAAAEAEAAAEQAAIDSAAVDEQAPLDPAADAPPPVETKVEAPVAEATQPAAKASAKSGSNKGGKQ